MNGPGTRGIGMTSARTRDRLVERLREKGIHDPRVLAQIRNVPRHLFVDEALASRAYEDDALPIGQGQTISQPYVVARMTEAVLAGGPVQKVLEIGTGCGYQAAVLASLVGHVYSVERIGALARRAVENLSAAGVHNVTVRHADGHHGMRRFAPFQAIVVTAAPESVPEALLRQLDEGGRLVIPVGPQGAQELQLYVRCGDEVERSVLDMVSFVPMLGSVT